LKFVRRKLPLLLLAALSALSLTTYGTLALLTDQTDFATNTFALGEVKCAIEEDAWDGNDNKAGDGVIINPGQPISKDPSVRNEGTELAWIRVKVFMPTFLCDAYNNDSPLHTQPESHDLFQFHNYTVTEANPNGVPGINDKAAYDAAGESWPYTGYWIPHSDYYYYSKITNPPADNSYGELTAPLFEKITLHPHYLEMYFEGQSGVSSAQAPQGVYYLQNLDIVAEAVQAEFNTSGLPILTPMNNADPPQPLTETALATYIHNLFTAYSATIPGP
jgi:hypothetical protein